jgi:hypothetical protein
MPLRLLAGALCLNRIAFGLAYLVAPGRFARSWIGRVAIHPAAQVFTRGHGARDVALGLGALIPLIRGDERSARPWMAGQALADGSDVAATVAARRRLPRSGARFALAVAGVSTAVGTGTAAALGRSTDVRANLS